MRANVMRRPRIGFLTERMLLGFGVDLVIHKTAEGLAALGYDVTVFPSVSDGTFANARYRIVPLGIPASRIFPRYEWNALKQLTMLRAEEIDLFFLETFPLFALGPLLAKPFVVVEYGVCSTTGFPVWLKAEFLYMRLMQDYVYYPFAAQVVTISHFLRERLPFFLRRRAHVIYPGVDHYGSGGGAARSGKAIRERFGVPEDEMLLLYVGRINPRHQPYKGTAQLVECVERLKAGGERVQLLMVGFGSEEDERWLAAHQVHCWRSAPIDAMGDIYAAADIFVTASQWEGFDMPLAEAQWFGKPAVAFRVGAHSEVVQPDETAYLVDSPDAFESAVRRLARDPGLRHRMGERARASAARFSWASAVAAYDALIRETVPERTWTR
jgi:glycosyltransferase involved in cell wall biosynthesis